MLPQKEPHHTHKHHPICACTNKPPSTLPYDKGLVHNSPSPTSRVMKSLDWWCHRMKLVVIEGRTPNLVMTSLSRHEIQLVKKTDHNWTKANELQRPCFKQDTKANQRWLKAMWALCTLWLLWKKKTHPWYQMFQNCWLKPKLLS